MIDEQTLQTIHTELDELNTQLADPAVYATSASRRLVNRQRELTTIIDLYKDLKKTETDIEATKGMLLDSEMAELAEHELETLTKKQEQLTEQLTAALVPSDPNDGRNAIIEIRAGAGGDESSLFAGEMMRMYARYAETHNLKIELLSESPNEVGGYKEVIFQVNGEDAYKVFKYESGVHRVQRIPATESAGRIHTSTVTVAVLPEAEEEDLVIDPNELRIDVYRSSGHGGQSVNTTDSAVRITHLPSGIVVTCQDEKSQLKNKTKALSVLRSRLLAIKEEEERKSQGEARLAQIGSGDRSEKIRTYNFPQDRLTDHRIGYTTHNLAKIMDGELGELFDSLHRAYIQNYIDQQK